MFKIQVTFFCSLALLSASLHAAGPKEELLQAAKGLSEKGSYSWRTTVTVPPDAQFRPGPTEGKTEKDKATHLKMMFNDSTTEAIIKGKGIAVKTPNEDWQSLSELENSTEGPGRFMATRLRNFKAPAEQAEDLAKEVKELKKEGDIYSGDLTEEGAKNLMRFRRGSDGPQISNAKGTAKFWVQDGVLSKVEYKVTGSMNFNGNDIDINRTTTTEIKEVGAAKVSVPEAAQKKLS